jgi:hypothetical protein
MRVNRGVETLVVVLVAMMLVAVMGTCLGPEAGAATPRPWDTGPPTLTTSTGAFFFAFVTLGHFESGDMRLTNVSNSTDVVDLSSDVTFAGPGSNDWVVTPSTDCPGDGVNVVVLASGSSCTVIVSFFPGAIGNRSAYMSIPGLEGSILLSASGSIDYFQVDTRGHVNVFEGGNAEWSGDAGSTPLDRPVVGMAATPDGKGYWLVASDGGVFSYGDAQFYGSAGSIHLNEPVVGMAAMPDGLGYWLSAADGGVFNYGDAPLYNSPNRVTGPALGTVVAMASDGRPTRQAIADLPALHDADLKIDLVPRGSCRAGCLHPLRTGPPSGDYAGEASVCCSRVGGGT